MVPLQLSSVTQKYIQYESFRRKLFADLYQTTNLNRTMYNFERHIEDLVQKSTVLSAHLKKKTSNCCQTKNIIFLEPFPIIILIR